jgi:hypothetical protein
LKKKITLLLKYYPKYDDKDDKFLKTINERKWPDGGKLDEVHYEIVKNVAIKAVRIPRLHG